MPRSSSASVPPKKAREPDPATVDISAALKRLVDCLTLNPATKKRRVMLRHIFNPAVPAELHRHEDRTECVLTRLLVRMVKEANTLTVGQAEWCLVRAAGLHNAVLDGGEMREGDVDFVMRMLREQGLFKAVQAQKVSDSQPFEALLIRRSKKSGVASGLAPDATPQIPVAAL